MRKRTSINKKIKGMTCVLAQGKASAAADAVAAAVGDPNANINVIIQALAQTVRLTLPI